MKLREYQEKLVNKIKQELLKGNKSVVAILGCGGGKSIIQADIAKNSTDKENRVLFLVHRKELCEQIKNTFREYGVNMALCTIVSIQTYRNNPNEYHKPNLILIDEAHTNLNAYKKVFEDNNCIKLGFTATPTRLKEGGLGDLFDSLVESVSTKWLIENNYLSDFKYYSVPLVNTDNIKIRSGEYIQAEINDIMENKIIYEGAVNQWMKLAKDKKTIVYCASIEASKNTADEFNKHNLNAVHLDGTTPKKEREHIIKEFREGKIKILCNAMLFSEGYDDKYIECVMLLRPTMSLALHTQQAMRGMRYLQGKTTIIIDCVGNVYKHGLPTEQQEWDLSTKERKRTKKNFKECVNCFAIYEIFEKECPFCGYKFEKNTSESNKKMINADLVEIEKTFKLQSMKLKDFKAKDWKEVEEFRKAKNYKFLWSIYYCLDNNIIIPHKYHEIARSVVR